MNDLVIDCTSDPLVVTQLADRWSTGAAIVRLQDLRRLGPWGALRRLRRESHERSVLLVNEHRMSSRWGALMLLAALPRARRRSVMDRHGSERAVSWGRLALSELPFVLNRARVTTRVVRRVRAEIERLDGDPTGRAVETPGKIAFVRPDLGPALIGGGSLTHIRGVISGFEHHGCAVTVLTPAALDGIEEVASGCITVPDDPAYRLSVELPHLAYNETFLGRALEELRRLDVDLIYQRHALGAYIGVAAARRLGVPLVLEYNGPEVWIARHWGAARRHLGLFEEIERRCLRAADLVVAVSESLRQPLEDAGVQPGRIVVNPNGVDVERFDPGPSAAGREMVRREHAIAPDDIVVTFLGTFGPWHGSEILAEAACKIPPPWSHTLRFLFVGDGQRRASTASILERGGLADRSIFTGLVRHDAIPALLAASDICVAPHVPNADGSPFFGSPTKLFEYLASGRAVVASDLGQIGAVLDHERTAWLVPPGEVDALADAIVQLTADSELRRRLGRAAREQASRQHSWTAHVSRILERLASPSLQLNRTGRAS